MRNDIINSRYARRYNGHTRDLVLYLEALAKQERSGRLKNYIVYNESLGIANFVSYGMADLALLLRDHLQANGWVLKGNIPIKSVNVFIEREAIQLLKDVTLIDVKEEILVDDYKGSHPFISDKGRGYIRGINWKQSELSHGGLLYNDDILIGKTVDYVDPKYHKVWRLVQINSALSITWIANENNRQLGQRVIVVPSKNEQLDQRVAVVPRKDELYDYFEGFIESAEYNVPDATITELFALADSYEQVIAFIYEEFRIHLC